jgi:hypothetical protein
MSVEWIVVAVVALVAVGLAVLLRLNSSKVKEAETKIEERTGLNVEVVASFLLGHAGVLKNLLGEKYQPVVGVLVTSVKSVLDGEFSEEEAHEVVNSAFDAGIKAIDQDLSEEEIAVVRTVLDVLVKALLKDKEVVGKAVAMTFPEAA